MIRLRRGNDPCRECAPGGKLREHQTRARRSRDAARCARADTRRRRRCRGRRSLRPPASSAARCAAASMPSAMPLTTHAPARARRAISRARAVARRSRVPTIARRPECPTIATRARRRVARDARSSRDRTSSVRRARSSAQIVVERGAASAPRGQIVVSCDALPTRRRASARASRALVRERPTRSTLAFFMLEQPRPPRREQRVEARARRRR